MNNGTKRQPVSKGRRHVLNLHIVVVLTLYPTPLLESLQRSHHTTDKSDGEGGELGLIDLYLSTGQRQRRRPGNTRAADTLPS